MAMTKAERARMAELETALALCWPPYPCPKPMTKDEIEAAKVSVKPPSNSPMYRHRTRIALGWFVNAYDKGGISQGWSDGMYHSSHNITGEHASQQMGVMYATKREAAMALRIELSRRYAKNLAALDRIIAEESAA